MFYHTIRTLRFRLGLSEIELARRASVSRLTLRQIEAGLGNPTLLSLQKVSRAVGRGLQVVLSPLRAGRSEFSIPAISQKVERDGFDSWTIHSMEFVDEFRKSEDCRLVLLGPPAQLDPKLSALLASIVAFLCDEIGLEIPPWCEESHFLPSPWFPSDSDALKAMAIKESPLFFRRNNIFVLENFLTRA